MMDIMDKALHMGVRAEILTPSFFDYQQGEVILTSQTHVSHLSFHRARQIWGREDVISLLNSPMYFNAILFLLLKS